ncbi:MAG: hypothetical protein LBL80_01135 [Ruminococcus sp.]|jgi:hypothetical protein|nr:hypothetical protein [Ruminococcus sp.]
MVSDKYSFSSRTDSANIPRRFEEYGKFCGLSPTNARILSLLSEEMVGMVKAILPEFDAVIHAQNENNRFEIILSVDAIIKSKEYDELLKASDGKNSAFGKGLLGKIGDMFVTWAVNLNDNPAPMMSYTGMEMGSGISMVNGFEEWSMKMYLENLEEGRKPEVPDDGLERSIIVNLADDCKMSVKSSSVVMTVVKSFEETGFTSKK